MRRVRLCHPVSPLPGHLTRVSAAQYAGEHLFKNVFQPLLQGGVGLAGGRGLVGGELGFELGDFGGELSELGVHSPRLNPNSANVNKNALSGKSAFRRGRAPLRSP